MTICSTSAMVPVREFAGIDRARLMLAVKAAAAALPISSWRNVRRSVVIDQCVDWTSFPLARRNRYVFQNFLETPITLESQIRKRLIVPRFTVHCLYNRLQPCAEQ